jgi:hypothetical protein
MESERISAMSNIILQARHFQFSCDNSPQKDHVVRIAMDRQVSPREKDDPFKKIHEILSNACLKEPEPPRKRKNNSAR